MADFILEIGSEEIPARFLKNMEDELKSKMEAALNEHSLAFNSLEVASTPRRAVVYVHGLASVQSTKEEEIQGPPVRVAFDSSGNPTAAGLGFAKTQGVDFANVFTATTDKGDYLAVRKKTGGRSASSILAEICPELISGLSFPKRMRWGSSPFLYARPLHWVVAVLDKEVIPFKVADIESGRYSSGHRVHGEPKLEITSANDYFSLIESRGGLSVHASKRRACIVAKGNEMAAQFCDMGGKVLWKEELLSEVEGLTEHPVPIIGSIAEKYLNLPREVLLTSMETHQKCFGIEGEKGNLLPCFLTVLNMQPKDMNIVKAGWERVLTARLEDARFFWETDLAASFDTWLKALDNVIFLAPLGSMGKKTRRLEQLCEFLANEIGYSSPKNMARAGRLSKADLVSGMVGEFSSLQGIMGGIYAAKKGEAEDIASALREQYLPAGPESPIPSSISGAILSMSDKADTLVGCFGLGMIPTGAADPYALRRCSLGIIRIVLEYGLRFDVAELFAEAQDFYGDVNWKIAHDEALQKILDFVTLRAKNYATTARGYDIVLTESAFAAGCDDIWAAFARLEALAEFAKSKDFEKSVLTFKRAANIIRKLNSNIATEISGAYSTGLLQEEAEKQLAAKLEEIKPRFAALWQKDNFAELFVLIDEIRPAVDNFFDNVMVMCEDTKLCHNRLNLLKCLVDMLAGLADFNALQV